MQAVVPLNTKPNQNLSLSDQEVFTLCEALRASLARLQFQLLCVKNNLAGIGIDPHQARILEDEITEGKRVLVRLEAALPGSTGQDVEAKIEADTEALERAVLVSAACLLAAERETA